MPYDPLDQDADPRKPPAVPTEVFCLHCQREYESYLIEWRVETDADGKPHGFWCCPTPGCGGRGFGFDIFPTDPEYQAENFSWVWDEGGEGECDDGEFDDDLDLDGADGEAAGPDDRPPEDDCDIPW
jgi:hypothetical protein